MNNPLMVILSCIIAYLLGSISVGILCSKIGHGPDLRTVGSKNTGASNVQRTMGWKWGLITFFGDGLKGVLACLIGELLCGDHMAALLCGLLAVIGHNWPIYYHFKGGKGVSTSVGVMLYCFPIPGLICVLVTVLVIWITRYISLGSLTLVTLFAILVSVFWSGGNIWIILWACALMAICFYRHRANIGRLINGTENKLGSKAK